MDKMYNEESIDVDKYKAHSTQSAVTSKAKQSAVPLSENVKVLG